MDVLEKDGVQPCMSRRSYQRVVCSKRLSSSRGMALLLNCAADISLPSLSLASSPCVPCRLMSVQHEGETHGRNAPMLRPACHA